MNNFNLKQYIKLHGAYVVFSIGALGFLIIVVIAMFFTITSLRNTVKTQVYVAVDGKMYEARPESRAKKDKLDYELFTETWAYNMFSHDVNSLDERLALAKPLIYDKGYKYILSSYTSGKDAGWEQGLKNIRTLYETRDCRTYLTIDSLLVDMSPKDKLIKFYGKQKAVFSVGEDNVANIRFEIHIDSEANRSQLNPYGMMIKQFNYIN